MELGGKYKGSVLPISAPVRCKTAKSPANRKTTRQKKSSIRLESRRLRNNFFGCEADIQAFEDKDQLETDQQEQNNEWTNP